MRRTVLFTAAALVALPVFAATAAIPETESLLKGAAYIKTLQMADGSYAADPGQNMDAIFAVRAAGYDPAKDLVGGVSPVDYLESKASSVPNAAGAAKAALAAKALGLNPAAVNGVDLIAKITAAYDPATGKYAGDDFSQAIAMLGLVCTGGSVPPAAGDALKANQIEDSGGWGFGGFADADTTAVAIQALLASGLPKTDPAIVEALDYLKATQGADAGWGYDPTASNTSSTAYAIQALIALGENPESAAYTNGGVTPVGYLLSQQGPDGSFAGFDPAFATNQVLPALAGRTFCNMAETPITRVRPVVTTPTATPSAPVSPTAAPKPPSTGNASGPGETGAANWLLVTSGALALAAAGALAAGRRRN